jgi:hypothetical protein
MHGLDKLLRLSLVQVGDRPVARACGMPTYQMVALACQHGFSAAGLGSGRPYEQVDHMFPALVYQGRDRPFVETLQPTPD